MKGLVNKSETEKYGHSHSSIVTVKRAYNTQANTTTPLKEELDTIFAPLKELDKEKIQFFIHGSWADNSRTAFSDLDDFIIVDDDYYETARPVLQKIERTMQKIDPLQHHGHWLIMKSSLDDYDNSFMPLFIMEDAVSVYGNPVIEAHVNTEVSLRNTISNCFHTLRDIDHWARQLLDEKITVFQLKGLVSSISLIPPLLFQVQGQETDKKSAILNASSMFSSKGILLLKWATEIREKWSELLSKQAYTAFLQTIDFDSEPEALREYIKFRSPGIPVKDITDIKISHSEVDAFLEEAISIADRNYFRKLSQADYEKGYKIIEEVAEAAGATYVAGYGNIGSPGISDLDMVIVFPDEKFLSGSEKVSTTIKEDDLLSYLCFHDPLYLCKSNIERIGFLHTLHEIKPTVNIENLQLAGDAAHQHLLHLIWAYFVYRQTLDMHRNIHSHTSRDILLQLKMVHKSMNFLSGHFNASTDNYLERTNEIRQGILQSEIDRAGIVREFEKTVSDFYNMISTPGKKGSSDGKRLYAGKTQVLTSSDSIRKWENKRVLFGVSYENIPSFFYDMLERLFFEKQKEEKAYMGHLRNYLVNLRAIAPEIEGSVITPFGIDVCLAQAEYNQQFHRKRKLYSHIKRAASFLGIKEKPAEYIN